MEQLLMKKLQLTFNNKFTTIQRIGLSPDSQVYLGYEAETEKQYAIKLERLNADNKQLEREAKIYRLLKGGVGFPNLYWYGVENDYNALVTDIYGPSLEQLMKFCGGRFSLKTVLLVMDQILQRIRWVHSKNLTYNDVCPENFLVGLREKADKIFIVDFGNCKKFIDENSSHIEFRNDPKPFKSSSRFKSIYAHIGKTLSRRDDLESLGYLLVFMIKGKLPWDSIEEEEAMTKENLIKQLKVSIPINILCEDLPKEFQDYFNYVRSLEFEEEPDYTWMRRLFKDLFDKSGYQNNLVMDWAEKHKY